jgi:hypothetical protein
MSNSKISSLPASTAPLAGTEVLPIVQSSTTKQVSVANLTAGRTQTSNGIVQGTAATGYNFTANTSAAGKTSQLLNWYEEGTWTPTDGSGASLSLSVQSATYTRIGRSITAQAYVIYPSTASALAAKISGFPFAPISTANYYSPTIINTTASVVACLRAYSGGIFAIVTANGNVDVTNAQLTGALVLFSLTYFA